MYVDLVRLDVDALDERGNGGADLFLVNGADDGNDTKARRPLSNGKSSIPIGPEPRPVWRSI